MPFEQFEYKTTAAAADEIKGGAVNLDEAQGIVECFVAGIGNKDSVGDIVVSGAFTKSLMRRKPRVVWGHNWNDPIGKVLEIYEVGPSDRRLPMKMKMAGIGGLFAKVQFNLNSEKGREAFANVAFFGEEQEWSIGYKTIRAQYDQKSQANVIYELELYEVSPVLHGANQLTGTISVKAQDPYAQGSTMEMEDEYDPSNISEIEKQLSALLGGKVSVNGVSADEVFYSMHGQDGTAKKFKCPYHRDGSRFMFGQPQLIVVAPKPQPSMPPQQGPALPAGQPQNDPRRIVRPQQMPGIPVAIKPGPDGMVMVPLPPVEYEGQNTADVDKTGLDQEEADLRDALLKIVKRHGKFDEDSDGVYAGYKPAASNPIASIGVKCANCVFYQGGSSCKIIAMDVEPEGKCRFAVIPKGVVKGDLVAKKEYELIEKTDRDLFTEELEFKYPGELLVAAVRGAIKRGRRRRKKNWKMLSEFGKEDSDFYEQKSYCIPVMPTEAFRYKQALDPIFDYYGADAHVSEDGIIITSGVGLEMIEAVDTAMNNIKKKELNNSSQETKNAAYRLGRAIGSRLIDRPSIGSGRRRLGRGRVDIPTGGTPGSRKPTGSNFDPDRDGWVDEGTTRPRFVGVPTETAEQASRAASGRGNPLRHQMPNSTPNNEENRLISEFSKVAEKWKKSGNGWVEIPRGDGDDKKSPNYLRGRELGYNQSRLNWKRLSGQAKDDDPSSEDYAERFYQHSAAMSDYLDSLRSTAGKRNAQKPQEYYFGIDEAIREDIASRIPDTSDWDRNDRENLSRWLEARGFGKDGNDLSNSLASGKRDVAGTSPIRRATDAPIGDDFDPDNPYGEDNEPSMPDFDLYQTIIDEFLGGDEEPEVSRQSTASLMDQVESLTDEGLRAGEIAERLGISIEEAMRYRRIIARSQADRERSDAMSRLAQVAGTSAYKRYLSSGRRNKDEVVKYDGPVAALSSGKKEKLQSQEGLPEDSAEIQEIYSSMAEQVIAALERALADPSNARWNLPWRNPDILAKNPTRRNHVYQGTNLLNLMAVASNRGYKKGLWAGASQWENSRSAVRGKKPKIRDGEIGVEILVPIERTDSATGERYSTGRFKVETVYNVAQVENLPQYMYEVTPPDPNSQTENPDVKKALEEIAPVIVSRDKTRAFYSPSRDYINMPDREQFGPGQEGLLRYLGTLLHETVHWTGHPSRTDRDQTGRFGTPSYAAEELVAEIGSAFALAMFGLEPEIREDHVQYLKSWLKALRNDPSQVQKAIKKAQEAVDFLIDKSETMRVKAGVSAEEARQRRIRKEMAKGQFIPITEGMEGAARIPRRQRRMAGGYAPARRVDSTADDEDELATKVATSDTQRSADGRVYDPANRLSSGARRAVERRDGSHTVPRAGESYSFRDGHNIKIEPTDQQRDILDTVLAVIFDEEVKPGVVTISAGAGTGKTTTLKAVMRSIENEFQIVHLENRPEALKEKLKYLEQKHGARLEKLMKEKGIQGKFSDLDYTDARRVLQELDEKAKSKVGFYLVFGKKNQEEAEIEFGDNTGVSTLAKMVYWSLRLGSGDEKYGIGMRRKMEVSLLDRKRLRGPGAKDRVVKFKKVDGTDGEIVGSMPSWRDLGYVMLNNENDFRSYLKLDEIYPDGAKVTMAGGAPAVLTPKTVGSILQRALLNFLNSADDEISDKHFGLTKMQEEQLIMNMQLGRTIHPASLSWENSSLTDTWVGMLRSVWSDITDGESSLLPPRNALEKLWALTNPDLRSDPGIVGHAANNSASNIGVPAKSRIYSLDDYTLRVAGFKIEAGDLADDRYVGWVVRSTTRTGKDGATIRVNLSRPYGTKDEPVSLFLLDEAQDMNATFEKVIANNRDRLPIVMVGDPRQAILAFRGSKDILSSVGGDYRLDLNESFRYGPNIAYAANIILAKANLDDIDKGVEDRWYHVAGLAVGVLDREFNFRGLTREQLLSRLIQLDKKYSSVLDLPENVESLASLIDDKEELVRVSADLRRALQDGAMGQLVRDMGSTPDGPMPDAILTRNNSGIIEAAMSFFNTWQPTVGQDFPIIVTSRLKWKQIRGFFAHLQWITGKDPNWEKPKASDLIGDMWLHGAAGLSRLEELAQQPQHQQLATLWNLFKKFSKQGPDGRKWYASTWLEVFQESPNPGKGSFQIIPERKMKNLSENIENPFSATAPPSGADLVRQSQKKPGGGQGGAQNRDVRFDIIPKSDSTESDRVVWALDVEGEDAQGPWTGGVAIFGGGVNQDYIVTDPKTGREKKVPQGNYYRDMKKIVDEMALGNKIRFVKNGRKGRAGKQISFDMWVIKGDDENETAAILAEVGRRLRESAKTQSADIEITTAQAAKGREWENVKLWEDFTDKSFVNMKPWSRMNENEKEAVVNTIISSIIDDGTAGKRRAKKVYGVDLRGVTGFDDHKKLLDAKIRKMFDEAPSSGGTSPTYREELNIVYVAITRAKKMLDMGYAISDLYFRDSSNEERAIADAIARGDMPAELSRPVRYNNPYIDAEPPATTEDEYIPVPSIEDVLDPGVTAEKPKKKGRPKKVQDGEEQSDDDSVDDTSTEFDDTEDTWGEVGGSTDTPPSVDNTDHTSEDDDDDEDGVSTAIDGLSSGRRLPAREAFDLSSSIDRGIQKYAGKRVVNTPGQRFGDNEPGLMISAADMIQFETSQDASNYYNSLARRGKLNNILWASENIDSDDKATRSAARSIARSGNSLSSGRSARRVIRSIDEVRNGMAYDYESAGFRFDPTPEQKDVIDAIMTGDDVVVRALAGTGKTSTLELAAKRLLDQEPGKRVVYLTFTRRMTKEAEKKFAKYPNVEVRTWDSVAYAAIVGRSKKMSAKYEGSDEDLIAPTQYKKIAEFLGLEAMDSADEFDQARVMARALDIYSASADREIRPGVIARAAAERGISLSDDELQEVLANTKRMWKESLDEDSKMGLNRSYVIKAWALTDPDLSTGDGMRSNTDGNDVIFFDEAQDANPIMSDIMRRQKIQKVVVGDSNQAIYGFRGAVDEMDKFNAKYQMQLTNTFRFNQRLAAIGNRFLSAHEKIKKYRGTNTPSDGMRLLGRGEGGEMFATADSLPEGIEFARNRMMPNGRPDTFAYLTQTNATAFKYIIEAQDRGLTTGSVSTFRDDLRTMVDYTEWLVRGKQGKRPKRFEGFADFDTWEDVKRSVEAARPGGGPVPPGVKPIDPEGMRAYTLMSSLGFDFARMRQAIDKIVVNDDDYFVSRAAVDPSEIVEDAVIEIVDGGMMFATVSNGKIILNRAKGHHDAFMARKKIFNEMLGFKFDKSGDVTGWKKSFNSPEEAAEILTNLKKMVREGIAASGASSDSPFNDRTKFGQAVGTGSMSGFMTEVGEPGISLSFSKGPSGKIRVEVTGKTYPVLAKPGPVKQGFSDARVFRWDKDKKVWFFESDSEDEAFEKVKKTRESMGISSSDSTEGGTRYLVPPIRDEDDPDREIVDVVAQTAHRSKGLEYGTVILADDFNQPTPEKDQTTPPKIVEALGSIGYMSEEDLRLQYVAATRALRNLVIGSLDWILGATTEEDGEYKETKTTLSSGRRQSARAARRTRLSSSTDELMRGVVPRGSSRDRTGGSGPDVSAIETTGPRMSRRQQRLSSGARVGTAAIAGMRTSPGSDEIRFAMRFWDGFRKRGITLDSSTSGGNIEERRKAIRDGIDAVAREMGTGPRFTVGRLSDNNPQDARSDNWMLSVDRLRESIRVPTEFSVDRDSEDGSTSSVSWTQSEPLSVADLAKMLNLGPNEVRQLQQPGAGLSHDAVRRLISVIGNRPEFSTWRLFSAVSNDEPEADNMSSMQRFAENIARANMRDRFIIETFGKDAYPYWYDSTENEIIPADEYARLGEISPEAKFLTTGSFSPTDKDYGSSEIESDIIFEGTQARPSTRRDPRNVPALSRGQFPLSRLLEHLDIDEAGDWRNELRQRMQASFGTDDVGLSGAREGRLWAELGVPLPYVKEMIRTGMIPSSSDVWAGNDDSDYSLSLSRANVYQALTSFIDSLDADRSLKTNEAKASVLGDSNFRKVVSRAKDSRGKTWAPRKGSEQLMGMSELEAIVKRLNDAFGSERTVEDVFSAEQIRAAKDLIEKAPPRQGSDRADSLSGI